MRITQLSGIFLATVMLCGSIPLGFSEPLRVQLEQGLEINEIQCDNPDNVLVYRTNGKLACVSERTADRLGWEIVETKINSVSVSTQDLYDNTSSVLVKSDKPYNPKDFPLNQNSDSKAMQRAPFPTTIDNPNNPDKIVRFDSAGNIFQQEAVFENNFPTSQLSPDGTTTQARTIIIDQWMPTVILDGQELKTVGWSGPLEVRGYVTEGLSVTYAPVDVVLTPQNYTGTVHDVNGISMGVVYWVSTPKTLEDILWYENKIIDFGNWERDTILGKRALVAEGDNIISAIEINTEDYRFGLASYRYNVAELTEILESIPALQPSLDIENLSYNVKVEQLEIESSNKVSSLYDNTSSVLIKSDGEFVPKDKPYGIYSEILAKQRAPAPMPIDNPFTPDKIVRFDSAGNIFQQEAVFENNFPISQSSPDGTTTQPRTFIIDQWVPETIPSGYELKIMTWSGPLEVRGYVNERLSMAYAPVDEILTPQNYTGTVHDIQGFSIGGSYWVTSPHTLDDIINFEEELLSYGLWERDNILGKRSLVAEGTDDTRSAIRILDPDYRFGASSYYHTVEELTEILESIPALQP